MLPLQFYPISIEVVYSILYQLKLILLYNFKSQCSHFHSFVNISHPSAYIVRSQDPDKQPKNATSRKGNNHTGNYWSQQIGEFSNKSYAWLSTLYTSLKWIHFNEMGNIIYYSKPTKLRSSCMHWLKDKDPLHFISLNSVNILSLSSYPPPLYGIGVRKPSQRSLHPHLVFWFNSVSLSNDNLESNAPSNLF